MRDLLLAIGHHLFVFTLVSILAIELALLRPGLRGDALDRLARIDAGYGTSALLILAFGVSRVFFGIKGPAYYAHNPWFWGKMTAFALVGLTSIVPTMRFLRWRRAARTDRSFAPSDNEVASCRSLVRVELGFIVIVIGCAAAMARIGLF